jgi:branched-chain amino acid transport system permease protein
MSEIFGVPTQALFGQLLIGLINGSFYALLSLGLAVIFGLLNIINFTHGAQYMMGAFVAYFLANKLGLGYWWALVLVPLVVGATGVTHRAADALAPLQARSSLRPAAHVRHRPHHRGRFPLPVRLRGIAYAMPERPHGGMNLGFMFLPNYRAWVIVASPRSASAPGT